MAAIMMMLMMICGGHGKGSGHNHHPCHGDRIQADGRIITWEAEEDVLNSKEIETNQNGTMP